jgi:hypothetical protein
MTRDIWNKYKNGEDSYGFAFKDAIFSGSKNVDSGIGVYAGSENSYTVFNELFDKVIEDYHGHGLTDTHKAEDPNGKINAPDFPEDEAAMILSTRIRVGRNLDGFPLGPGLTNEKRVEIEEKVVHAVNNFSEDLQGKYYSLDSLSEAERQQLIDDHFLFKEGDRFL